MHISAHILRCELSQMFVLMCCRCSINSLFRQYSIIIFQLIICYGTVMPQSFYLICDSKYLSLMFFLPYIPIFIPPFFFSLHMQFQVSNAATSDWLNCGCRKVMACLGHVINSVALHQLPSQLFLTTHELGMGPVYDELIQLATHFRKPSIPPS